MKRQNDQDALSIVRFDWLPIEIIVGHVIATDAIVFGRLLCTGKRLGERIARYNDADVFYRLFKGNWPDAFCCLYELVCHPDLFIEPLTFYAYNDQVEFVLRYRFGYNRDTLCELKSGGRASSFYRFKQSMRTLVQLDCDLLRLNDLGYRNTDILHRAEKDVAFAARVAALWPLLQCRSVAPWQIYMHWHHQTRKMVAASMCRLCELRQRLVFDADVLRQYDSVANEFVDRLYCDNLSTELHFVLQPEYEFSDINALLLANDASLVAYSPEKLTRDAILEDWRLIVVPFMREQALGDDFCESVDWLPHEDVVLSEKRFIDTIDATEFKKRLSVYFDEIVLERPRRDRVGSLHDRLSEMREELHWFIALTKTQQSFQNDDAGVSNAIRLYECLGTAIDTSADVSLESTWSPYSEPHTKTFFRLLFEYYVRK